MQANEIKKVKITNQAEYDAMLAFLNGAPSGSEFFHPTLRLYVRNSPYIQNNINEFVEIMRHDGWCGNLVLSDFFDELLCLKDIKYSLLEYRRANKIYEAGDLVVFSNSNETKPVLMKIKEFRNFNLVHLEIVSSGICGPSYKDDIRHANDAEIEAKRRLDLPQVSSIIKANFKNAAGEYIQVIGKVRELKGRTICCNEVGTGKPFFCLPGEFKKYDLPKSVILSLGEVS